MSEPGPRLSIVLPMRDEAGNIGPLLGELRAAFAGQPVEIVVVDDGGVDGSGAEAAAALAGWPRALLLRHARSGGKSRALRTGFAHACGDWIATLDADGQNDPADLARLWAEARDGPPALYAGARTRRNDGPVKFVTSRVGNAVRRALLRDDAHDSGCGLKLMPAALARELPYFDNMHRFLPALARRAGLEVRERPIADRPRAHGVSKYGFFDRASVGLADLLGVWWLRRRYSDPGAVTLAASSQTAE